MLASGLLLWTIGGVVAQLRLTLGDLGGAVGRLDQDIATLGTQSRGNSLGQSVNTLEEVGTSLNAELELLFAMS